MKLKSKNLLFITLGLLLIALKAPPVSASLNNKDSHQTIISNPLVCLVGVSEYDMQKELPSVREEMRELYDLFYFDCGYEVNATFPYDKQYASSHKDLPKMRLSLGDLNQFLKQSYKELYQKADFYDGLIFVFSGHGFINEYNCPLIATSDCKLQKRNNGKTYELIGCTYFDDVKAQLTKLKKDDPKEKFVSKPKIFFNLSCQSNPAQNLPKEKKKKVTFPERALQEEEKSGSILAQRRFDKLKMKGAKNIITISSAVPGFATGTQAGLKIVKCLRTKFKNSLGQQSNKKSLYEIIKHVREHVRNPSCAVHINHDLISNRVFFLPKIKRTIILMDGKTAMITPLEAARYAIPEAIKRIKWVLRKHKMPCDSFSVQFVAYRNYKRPEELLEHFKWESSGDDMRQYMYTVKGRSSGWGNGAAAIEIGLAYAYQLHQTMPISQVILIAYNPSNSYEDIYKLRAMKGEEFWRKKGGLYTQPTYWRDEVINFKNVGVPIHAFFPARSWLCKKGSNIILKEIAETTGGEYRELDMYGNLREEEGYQQLVELFSNKILRTVGGEELAKAYQEAYNN